MKEITLTQTDDIILPPPEGNIILTGNGVVVMTIDTLIKATDNVVQITGLRQALSGRKKGRKNRESET